MRNKILLVSVVVAMVVGLVIVNYGLAPSPASPALVKAPPIQPEISFTKDGAPIQPIVRPVVILSGSDYEMGYQYFQQLVQIYGAACASRYYFKLRSWTYIPFQHGKFTKKELAELDKYEQNIKKYTPEMIDFMKGMADGATDAGIPLSYHDVLNIMVIMAYDMPGCSGKAPWPLEEDCSGWAAWGSATKDGKLYFGGTGDLEITVYGVLIMAFPKTGNNYICTTDCGPAWHPAMNNKGLAYVHHGGCRPGPVCSCGNSCEVPYALPMPFGTMHTLRFANNADQAKDMMLAMPILAGGLWVDIAGRNWCIECRELPAMRKAGDLGEKDFIYATNNGLCRNAGLPGWNYVPLAGWVGPKGQAGDSITRNLEAWNLFTNYHGKVDLEFGKMLWRFPGTKAAGLNERYFGAKTNSAPSVGIPDNGDEGLFYEATGSVIRSDPMPVGYFRPNNTYAYMQLKLAANPPAVVAAAKSTAWKNLHKANMELVKLSRRDPAFASLEEIFNQACIEYTKGAYYEGIVISGDTTGNETIYRNAKALRAFTTSQCLAQKIYEALVPPATSPEELGLQPWFGPWANWKTWP